MSRKMNKVEDVSSYWNTHTLGLQYQSNPDLQSGTPEFFAHLQPWMNPYKFPWIMQRIEREAALLCGRRLLEIGCGMGYDSLEFLKRGVRVTATDLTENAVLFAARHFEIAGVKPEAVQVEDVLRLSFADGSFDAVWANGVIHHSGDPQRALDEIRRVLKPGGRAIISHFYRRPSWMWTLQRLGREPIEAHEEDPPVTEFYTEPEILRLFRGFTIVETAREHHRALPIAKRGLKAALYRFGFAPLYNLLPEALALRYAYKFSVTAVRD